MKGPTLGEVKDYFKEVGTVVCLSTRRNFDISKHIPKDIYENIEGCWVWINLKGSNCVVWNKEKGYAEILENRKYTITKDQLMIIHEKTSVSNQEELKEWFPEVFENKKHFGKWYNHAAGGIWKIDSEPDGKGNCYVYGFTRDYKYFEREINNIERLEHECDSEEVTEAFKKEAVKRGYREGVWINRDLMHANTDTILIPYGKHYFFDVKHNILYLNEREVFSKGIWAEIIPTKTIQEAEKLLNCKIV